MYSFKGKKLLILGGAFQHCKVVEAAHKLGIVTYVADYLTDSPAKKMADKALLVDIKDIDALVSICREEMIDGVITTSLDPCQIPYQKICEQLDYPCFGTEEQFHILTNKKAFEKCCKKYGVDIIPSYSEKDIELFCNGNIQIDFPVVVKPVDSRGSRGQAICRDINEVKAAIEIAKSESSNGQVVIEKYMGNCDDFTMTYLFIDGNAYLIRTGDRYLGTEENGLNRVAIAATSPSKHTELFLKYVNERVIHMLKAIGIKNGPVFIQGFVDGNTVRFYDPGLRFSGGEYERLLKLSTGVDIIEMLVKFALCGRFEENGLPEELYKLGGKYIMQLCPTLKEGRIAAVCGEEKLRENGNIITYSPRYGIGDNILLKHDVGQRFAEICILSDDLNKEAENVKFVQETLHIIDTKGHEMLYDSFDVNRLFDKD
ncbi:MAG: hypothetical protein K2J91_02300 [Lachnospiraceae bacterium]|nr:hypothetical protein [Lachnospiraceae bacterium]